MRIDLHRKPHVTYTVKGQDVFDDQNILLTLSDMKIINISKVKYLNLINLFFSL